MKPSLWTKWLAQPGHIRAVFIEATALMRELCEQQGLRGQAQAGFSDAVVGSMLIASAHKSNESINMNAKGSGPYRQAIVDASPEGRVRGFLLEQTDLSMQTFGEKGTNGPWGSGILSILYTKNFEGKMPYTGMVPISTGYLDQAINEYYRDSEQLTSMVGLSIVIDREHVVLARGVLLQALGGATESELARVNALTLTQLREFARVHDDATKPDWTKLWSDVKFAPTEELPLKAFCNCGQERIERALILTGEADIREALGQDEMLKISCDFCRKEYGVSRERIHALFATTGSRLQ